MRGDEQRAAPPAEVLLEPLERVEVEVVGRLVEQQQVRIGDDQPGQRRPRLLAARQRGRRLRPLVAGEAEAGQRALDPLVERVAAEDLEPVQELGVGAARRPVPSRSIAGQPLGHPLEVGGARPDRRPQVRRGHERLVEVRLLGEQPEGQAALAMDLAAVGLVAPGGEPQQRRLAGAVRPDEADPVAERDRRVDRVEDDERADLAGDARQAQDAHRAGLPRRAPTPAPRPGASRRPASFARSGPGPPPEPPRRASARRSPPRPARSSGRPARRGPPVIVRRIAAAPFRSAAPSRWHHEQKCVDRAPDDDPLDRPAAARAGLAGALVDLQVLLHLAVAVGRGVVVDRAAAPLDGLGQDPPDRLVEAALVGRAQRAGRPQRMEPRRPQRLVGVDVADPGEEGLVEQERLEPALPPPQPAPEVAHRERRVERLRAERREDRRPADLGDELAGHRVAPVQPDPPELADVAEAQLAAVGQLEDEPDVRVLRRRRPARRTAGRSS